MAQPTRRFSPVIAQWTEEQKRAIVAESFAPGAMVSDVARRADISSGQIYRWRQE
jgi:transposase